MTRADLIALLGRYVERHPDEHGTTRRILDLLEGEPRCFERDCFPGHITASAWIVSRESRKVLLTHHRKLDRWLQLGGHTDGDSDVLASALREAREESGIAELVPIPSGGEPRILDVDVHEIPARPTEPPINITTSASCSRPPSTRRSTVKSRSRRPCAGFQRRASTPASPKRASPAWAERPCFGSPARRPARAESPESACTLPWGGHGFARIIRLFSQSGALCGAARV